MERDRTGRVILLLVFIIVILIGVVSYMLLVRPAINGYVIEKQIEAYNKGVEDAVTFMLKEINQRGYTQVSIGNETIFLTPFKPQQ